MKQPIKMWYESRELTELLEGKKNTLGNGRAIYTILGRLREGCDAYIMMGEI
jgi:hypothetical protein